MSEPAAMSETTAHNETPAVRPNPVRLGLTLGAAVVGLTIVFILIFSCHGLPKDPKEWRRIEQQRSASQAP
jgi:hypothetical protein